jgi:DMSO/TMAO reductase YedYZ molybdopterin-dependent catalytic subunit
MGGADDEAVSAGGDGISREELQLATRNHGMPLEALRFPVTPIGLHYVLTHYDIPVVDADAWRLTVGGHVRRPLELSLRDIRALPPVTVPVTMECAGNGRALLAPRPLSQPWLVEAVGTAEWTGVPLATVLERASLAPSAEEVAFRGLDRGVESGMSQNYERSLSIADATGSEVLLAYGMNGASLPPQHGYPLRLIVPGAYGMASVKWLDRISVLAEPFTGHQQATAYRMRSSEDDPGAPLGPIAPRALLVPPGIPEFPSRVRHLRAGRVELEGRAWSGSARIVRVDVSDDGGRTWGKAALGEPPGALAWIPWTFQWEARPGEHELCCRATDETGRTQPLEPRWNLGGYANNEVQRIRAVVTDDRT